MDVESGFKDGEDDLDDDDEEEEEEEEEEGEEDIENDVLLEGQLVATGGVADRPSGYAGEAPMGSVA